MQMLGAFPTNIYWVALGVSAQRKFTQLCIIMRCRFPTAAKGEEDYHRNDPSVNCFVASLAGRSSMVGLFARMAAQPWTSERERMGPRSENAKRIESPQQLQMTARGRARSRDATRRDVIHTARWDCVRNRIT